VFKNVLIIKPSSLGDVVNALPVLAKMREKYPDARISWLVGTAAAPIVESNPQLDRVFRFRRDGGVAPKGLAAHYALVRELTSAAFDCVIDLQGLLRSALLARVTGAPVRVGFDDAREGARYFYTERVDPGGVRHAVDRCLLVGAKLGFDAANPRFSLNVPEGARRSAERIFESPSGVRPLPYVVLSPGARWASKLWPAANFADAARKLSRRVGGTYFVTGTPGESDETARAIVAALGDSAVNLVGRTSLEETIALISRADLLVTPDSGPMHVADALGTPLVAVFGPTDPECNGPYFQRKRVVRAEGACAQAPCLKRRCNDPKCMTSITGDRVAGVAAAVLEGSA
jgi:lipopolysaccharide heptosyltransferase I